MAGCTGTGSCYWVGGDGNSNDPLHWATTSGGLVTGGLPSSSDDAIFDNQSSLLNAAYAVNVTGVNLECKDLVVDGPGGGNAVSFTNSGAEIEASGSLNFVGGAAGIDFSFGIVIHLLATSSKTLTFNGTDTSAVYFYLQGVGGTWALQDDMSCDFAGNDFIDHQSGTLDLNGNQAKTSYYYFDTAAARTIKDSAGGGEIITSFEFLAQDTTNLTVDRSNPWSIKVTGGNVKLGPSDGSGPAWPPVVIDAAAPTTILFTGGGTMKSLSVTTPPQTLSFLNGSTHGIEDANGFPSGTSGNIVTVLSDSPGTAFVLESSFNAQQCSDYLSLTDSTAIPAAKWFAGANSTDVSNNTGWSFIACPGVTLTPPPVSFFRIG